MRLVLALPFHPPPLLPPDPAQMTAMMEKMLRDANMQKMLYPYLPEPMRNPESIEWMLNNPEVRKQMEQVFAQSVSHTPQHRTAQHGTTRQQVVAFLCLFATHHTAPCASINVHATSVPQCIV